MRTFVALAAGALILSACGSAVQTGQHEGTAASSHGATASSAPGQGSAHPAESAVKPASLASMPRRSGERDLTLRIPDAPYTPRAEKGTDDYHCFLLDPGIERDSWITGVGVVPDNSALTHHAILYRVDPRNVAAARAIDAKAPGVGWTCFGGTGVESMGNALSQLDDAPWLAAWAPGGKPTTFADGYGVRLPKGSMVVLQMHYNLLGGTGADDSRVELRIRPDDRPMRALQTMLLPGPVELPCLPDESGPLCTRSTAVADVASRFGQGSVAQVGGLQLLCGGDPFKPKPGPTQTCVRRIAEPMTIVAAAGHMHLLGKSIRIDAEPRGGVERRLLDIPTWDFDDQGSRPLPEPVSLKTGDTVTVTCTHDAGLRRLLPELRDTPPRYVVWGEGTTDEMCLGMLIVTRP